MALLNVYMIPILISYLILLSEIFTVFPIYKDYNIIKIKIAELKFFSILRFF